MNLGRQCIPGVLSGSKGGLHCAAVVHTEADADVKKKANSRSGEPDSLS